MGGFSSQLDWNTYRAALQTDFSLRVMKVSFMGSAFLQTETHSFEVNLPESVSAINVINNNDPSRRISGSISNVSL